MNRWLVTGYAANLATILASILVARGNVPGFDQQASLVLSQGLLILLFPAGIMTLHGAVRSQGKLRRALGYSVFGLDLLLSLTGVLMGTLALFAGARIVS